MTDAGTGAEREGSSTETDESRSIVVGSFRRAFADTDSRLLKSYVVVSALFGGLVGLLLALALPVWILNTANGSELATFSRTFLVVGGVLLLVALVAPVVSAGRRHAREAASAHAGGGTNAHAGADALLALSGYLFVLSLYLALLISAPPGQREAPSALLAPAVEVLYALAPIYAVVPPLLGVALIGVVHLLTR